MKYAAPFKMDKEESAITKVLGKTMQNCHIIP
jgi:hypothetical protein